MIDAVSAVYVTIAQIIEAMEKNGLKQNKNGGFFQYKNLMSDSPIDSACIWGQAAINLGVSAFDIFEPEIEFQDVRTDYYRAAIDIAVLNDEPDSTYESTLAFAKKVLAPFSDLIIKAHHSEYNVVS